MTTTFSLKQGETRTNSVPIPHPLKNTCVKLKTYFTLSLNMQQESTRVSFLKIIDPLPTPTSGSMRVTRGEDHSLTALCESNSGHQKTLQPTMINRTVCISTVWTALTAHNWQKWKRVFLTCPCHKIYRDEAVGLKSCKYTWKITIFVKMWNLGQYRENLILCQ